MKIRNRHKTATMLLNLPAGDCHVAAGVEWKGWLGMGGSFNRRHFAKSIFHLSRVWKFMVAISVEKGNKMLAIKAQWRWGIVERLRHRRFCVFCGEIELKNWLGTF